MDSWKCASVVGLFLR